MRRIHRLTLTLKSVTRILLPVFFFSLFATGQVLAASYTAVEDAYTRTNKPSTNFGAMKNVRTQWWSDTTGFVKFDLGSIASSTEIGSAILQVPINDVNATGEISVHIAWGDFDERYITHDNQPGLSAEMASFYVSSSDGGETISVDVTNIAKALVQQGRNSIALTTTNASVGMGTHEGGAPMKLVITTSGSGNHTPTISGNPPDAVANSNYSFTPQATDPDGDSLNFSIQNKPPWANFSSTTGRIWGTPSEGAIGIHGAIRITASDGQASATLGPFDIEVMDDGNGSATLSWTAPTQNTDGSPLTDLRSYRIDVERANSTWQTSVNISNPSISTYVIENLDPATYEFTIVAINSQGAASAPSNKATKTVD